MGSFPVTRVASSRRSSINYDDLRFGLYFTDHIFVMDYSKGSWHSPRIDPNEPMAISPANMTLHYGQAVFEGLKAFRRKDGGVVLFRPESHVARLNRSCRALCIPELPEDTVLQGLKELIELERDFVPSTRGHSLYIRPFVIAMDNLLGVQSSQSFRLIILLSPVATYYPEGLKPVRLHVAQHHSRAAKGGLGMAKTPANYAASLLPAKKAKEKGYTQVLWLDAAEHTYIEEVGTMNIFFKVNGELFTPPLDGDTILAGITRLSVIELCRHWGLPVHEQRVTIQRLFEYHHARELKEVFGTGTAAVISPVGEIHYNNESMLMNGEAAGPMAQRLYDAITGIQYGEQNDPFGWVVPVC
ncbi:MAG: branched-chain amino acid aminotransferase [bacterium]|nr:branched-chain amino acid aminotransferase [bacterium]